MADMENEKNTGRETPKIQANIILIAIGLLLIASAILLYPQARRSMEARKAFATLSITSTPEPLPATATPPSGSSAEVYPPSLPDPELFVYPNQFGTLILSIKEGLDSHLFAYQPFLEDWSGSGFSGLPLTRLTSGSHQDITPDISKDGRWIAFSSNRDGPWDIYILDLLTGDIERFTNTEAYDANPSWSPDGLWLVYESYQINNLEIVIQDVNRTTGPIYLTNNPAADYAPDWSPHPGRWISFISDRSGKAEVWYANLDSPEEDKAVRINNLNSQRVQNPSWSGDGRYLTWGIVTEQGNHILVSWDSQYPDQDPVFAGSGDRPLWGNGADLLYAVVEEPYQTYLTAYLGPQAGSQLTLPAISLPGRVEGISWVEGNNYPAFTNLDTGPDPTPLWDPVPDHRENPDTYPKNMIELRNLIAPTPAFIESAVGSFTSLRSAVIDEAGWDFLSTLDNAFIALDKPLPLGVNLDWLYTGRGIMVNDIPRLADWLVLVREDHGSQIYWRIYIKAYNQYGYQGRPLHTNIWDLSARYSGDNAAYENGGAFSSAIPKGYWVDFTALAEAYGWMRFPTQSYWQTTEEASRYQYFAFTQGLDLETALLELYSPGQIRHLTQSANP